MAFLDDNYLLSSPSAKKIFQAVRDLPVVDPHNHANVAEIADNQNYPNVWQLFAATDHYVWSLMRRCGVPEEYVTGGRTPEEKFQMLGNVFPDFAGNPVYEWIHLDLKRYLGIDEVLGPDTAMKIYREGNAVLARPDMRPVQILEKIRIKAMCSTDDPCDLLEDHVRANKVFGRTVIHPTWRPDAAYNIQLPTFCAYVEKLGKRFASPITGLDQLFDALRRSHDYFAEHECHASDHGVEIVDGVEADMARAKATFAKVLAGGAASADEIANYHRAILGFVAELDAQSDWAFQLHFGAVRNFRTRIFHALGPDSGVDGGNTFQDHQPGLIQFFNAFDDRLKTVVYCFDPTHISMVASTVRAFSGKLRIGAPWWQCDNPIGMKRQLEYFGSVDLLSKCGGMVSDSRKLLSYGSRHEMFRRVLSDVLGNMAELGQAPIEVLEQLAVKLSFAAPKEFFGL